MEKIIRKFIKEQIKALHESKKHVVKYSKSNNTYQVWLGDEIVTDFATKERANAKAKNLNDLQNAKDVDKAQLKEAEVKGDIVNLHYRFDQVDDTKGIKQNLQNNETVNKYGIKVEFGEDSGNSFDVKFTIDRRKTAAMTAIRLLRDEVLEPIEKANKAVIIDIEPKNFQPKIDYDQMAQQSAMDDRRQQGMDPGLEEAARELGYLDEIGNFHDPRMSGGNFDRLTAPNPKDQVFKKKYIGNGMYDIFKNGKKVKTIKGEGEANAWINNAKRELDEAGNLNELNSYEMGELPDFELLRKNVAQMLGVEVDDDVRSGMYSGKEGYYSRINPRDLIFWEKEQIEKLKQAFKKTNFELSQADEYLSFDENKYYEFEYNNIFDFEEDPGERTYPAGFNYFATEKEKIYGDDDEDNFPDFKEAYTSEWDPETAAKNLRVAKGIEPKYTTYTKGEKVTYLGHPAVITGVKEYNGKIYYSVSYDKGNGKTKASSILSTDGTIKSLEEAKSKEDQLKIARAAFEKAEMNGDIRGQELALAALDLIKNGSIKGLNKPSRLKEMASELGYLNEDEQLSKLLQLSKHADVRDGEEKISKLAAAWDRWNYDNGDKYDDLVDHLFMAAELLGDGYRKEAQMRLKIFNKDVVKVMGGLSEEKENLEEYTISGGQEAARNYPKSERPGDMFAQKEVEELLPQSFASRNQELKARLQAHANWVKQNRFNNTFVHVQSNTVTDGNNTYRVDMSQHYNGNYEGFKNPKFTEIRVKELEGEMEKDLGYYIVDTTALMQDLRKLETIERVS